MRQTLASPPIFKLLQKRNTWRASGRRGAKSVCTTKGVGAFGRSERAGSVFCRLPLTF